MEKNSKDKEIKPVDDKNLQNESDSSEEDENMQEESDPTRYGDWQKNGRCVDF